MSTRDKISKEFKSKTGETFQINNLVGCYTVGVIYQLSCLRCKKQYVGQTGRRFRIRAMEHLRSIKSEEKTIGKHFTSECKAEHFRIQIIEKVFPNNEPF